METLLREALVRKTSHDSSTEHAQVIHHEIYVRQVLQKCTNLFSNYPHIQLYLVSEKDNIPIPSINCWCKKNCWMVQMDKHGLRLSEELSMVEAAASTLFQCIRQLPPQRRERKYIFGFLLNLIEELEKTE